MNNNDVLSPQIERYINEGNKDGSLNVEYPKQVSEIIVLLLGTWFIVALFQIRSKHFGINFMQPNMY
ncbi:hypothetical protein [Enterococcus ureasiticus]|uniref:hypothetical protein n=1 Tax=Enterococcus ureasiticus TaxID=903984 RepID=UPI001112E482|nr:hypothetical protein [Enterococcus ureasiticus]